MGDFIIKRDGEKRRGGEREKDKRQKVKDKRQKVKDKR